MDLERRDSTAAIPASDVERGGVPVRVGFRGARRSDDNPSMVRGFELRALVAMARGRDRGKGGAFMTTQTLEKRCPVKYGSTRAQCCLQDGHPGCHLYKCSSDACTGYPFPASELAHPSSCRALPFFGPIGVTKKARAEIKRPRGTRKAVRS